MNTNLFLQHEGDEHLRQQKRNEVKNILFNGLDVDNKSTDEIKWKKVEIEDFKDKDIKTIYQCFYETLLELNALEHITEVPLAGSHYEGYKLFFKVSIPFDLNEEDWDYAENRWMNPIINKEAD